MSTEIEEGKMRHNICTENVHRCETKMLYFTDNSKYVDTISHLNLQNSGASCLSEFPSNLPMKPSQKIGIKKS